MGLTHRVVAVDGQVLIGLRSQWGRAPVQSPDRSPDIQDQTVCKNDFVNIAYREISNIRCIKSQNLNVSRLVLQLSLCNLFKPGVKPKLKM